MWLTEVFIVKNAFNWWFLCTYFDQVATMLPHIWWNFPFLPNVHGFSCILRFYLLTETVFRPLSRSVSILFSFLMIFSVSLFVHVISNLLLLVSFFVLSLDQSLFLLSLSPALLILSHLSLFSLSLLPWSFFSVFVPHSLQKAFAISFRFLSICPSSSNSNWFPFSSISLANRKTLHTHWTRTNVAFSP